MLVHKLGCLRSGASSVHSNVVIYSTEEWQLCGSACWPSHEVNIESPLNKQHLTAVCLGVQPEELERLVEAAAAATNAAVVGAVLGRACLLRHCAAIKRYLLLGQVSAERGIRMTKE